MPSYRVLAVCFAAFAVSLPMVWISLAKLFLLTATLLSLAQDFFSKGLGSFRPQHAVTPVVLTIVGLFATSVFWTVVDTPFAWLAWLKHAKLIEILCISQLVKSPQESRDALICFIVGQGVVLTLSYLLAMGVHLPFSAGSTDMPIVFAESYIDQGVMTVIFGALIWHLRQDLKLPILVALGCFALAIFNVLALLPGRTGFVTAVVVVGLMVIWRMPKKFRLACVVIAPVLALALAYSFSPKVKIGLGKIVSESQAYTEQSQLESSSGWRLNAWHRSLKAIGDKPQGYGVGSWTPTVKTYQGSSAAQVFGNGNSSNPHQEHLLWGVELGVAGIFILLALWLCIWRTALKATDDIQHATLSVLAVAATACFFNSALYDDLLGDFLCVSLGLMVAHCLHHTRRLSTDASV